MQSQFQSQGAGTWPYPGTDIDYMVVAGGGAGGEDIAGAGGAGGYRASGYGPAPLQGCSMSLYPGTYNVIIGAGGAGGQPACVTGNPGNVSTFETITSAGGGGGKVRFSPVPEASGGSL